MNRALGSAVDHREEMTAPLVRRSDDDVRVARIDDDVGDAGVVGNLQHLRPRAAAVNRLVEAAFAARRPQRALRRDEHRVAVFGTDDDAADVLGGLEADVGPRTAAVVALVHAVAVRDRALRIPLAGADPHDVRPLRIDRHPSDRKRSLSVEDRLPRRAAVGRLPDAARRGADVDDALVRRIDGDRHHAARGHRRTDRPGFEPCECFGGERLRRGRTTGNRQSAHDGADRPFRHEPDRSEIDAQPDLHDPWRDDRLRHQVRRADAVADRIGRVRVHQVEDVELRHEAASRSEPERA